jgi:hypothetical protein
MVMIYGGFALLVVICVGFMDLSKNWPFLQFLHFEKLPRRSYDDGEEKKFEVEKF